MSEGIFETYIPVFPEFGQGLCGGGISNLSFNRVLEVLIIITSRFDYWVTIIIFTVLGSIFIWSLLIIILSFVLPPCMMTLVNYTKIFLDFISDHTQLMLYSYIIFQMISTLGYTINFFLLKINNSSDAIDGDTKIMFITLLTILVAWLVLILFFRRTKGVFYNFIFITNLTIFVLIISWHTVIKNNLKEILIESSIVLNFFKSILGKYVGILIDIYQIYRFIIKIIALLVTPCKSLPNVYLLVIQTRMWVITLFLSLLEVLTGKITLKIKATADKLESKCRARMNMKKYERIDEIV